MPMIGLIPSFVAALWKLQAPNMQPWSVRASAGISSSLALRTRSRMRFAPSRREYSEWVWRWTKLTSDARMGVWAPADGPL